jgi:hypothetical protein
MPKNEQKRLRCYCMRGKTKSEGRGTKLRYRETKLPCGGTKSPHGGTQLRSMGTNFPHAETQIRSGKTQLRSRGTKSPIGKLNQSIKKDADTGVFSLVASSGTASIKISGYTTIHTSDSQAVDIHTSPGDIDPAAGTDRAAGNNRCCSSCYCSSYCCSSCYCSSYCCSSHC